MWVSKCDMNVEKYEYECIPNSPPPTDGIGNEGECFFPKIIILAFQGILW